MTRHVRPTRALLASAFVLAILTAACGSGDVDDVGATADGGGTVSSGALAPGGGLTVAEALARGSDEGPIAVHGFILDDGRSVRMCSAVAESYPPQCGGDSFAVVGVDVAGLDGATVEGATAWHDDAQLVGVFDGETLTVDDTAI